MLFVCAFLNMDGAIASFNVRHCEELRGPGYPAIDVAYLESLGYDTVPALLWLSGQVSDHPRAGPRCRNAIFELKRELQADLEDWRGWTLRRARIWRLLQPQPPGKAPRMAPD